MTIELIKYTNTFVTLDEAQDYFDCQLYIDAWTNADIETRKKALIQATKKINGFRYIWQKKSADQALEFPRICNGFNAPELPIDIQDATCLEALALLEYGNSGHLKAQNLGIKSKSIGNESVTYKDNKQNVLLSDEAYRLVQKWTSKTAKWSF